MYVRITHIIKIDVDMDIHKGRLKIEINLFCFISNVYKQRPVEIIERLRYSTF